MPLNLKSDCCKTVVASREGRVPMEINSEEDYGTHAAALAAVMLGGAWAKWHVKLVGGGLCKSCEYLIKVSGAISSIEFPTDFIDNEQYQSLIDGHISLTLIQGSV